MIMDVIKHPFITVGFLSFVLLMPLALTSNQWAVRKLKRNWARLHQLIYLIAPLVILHYFWHKSGKNDYFTVSIYGAVLLILLAFRLRLRLKQ
jgi:sulfoxide reductase heme-binding subunit YedZ